MNLPGLPRFLRPVEAALIVASSVATALVVILVTADVVARYVFADSIVFANELARLMFVWAIFLGFPLALSRGRHVGIEFLDAVLARRWVRAIIRVGAVFSAILLAVIFWKSLDIMLFNWDQQLNTLPLSAGLFYLPVTISMAVSVVYLLAICFRGSRTLVEDHEPPGGVD
ncbi:MAG: TRAP transporter small permease [Rhodospirillales bacterium]|nr:TRAP transporter small permease [Rhodospirillales bacterium]